MLHNVSGLASVPGQDDVCKRKTRSPASPLLQRREGTKCAKAMDVTVEGREDEVDRERAMVARERSE